MEMLPQDTLLSDNYLNPDHYEDLDQL